MRSTNCVRVLFFLALAAALRFPPAAAGSGAKSPADYVNPLIDIHKSRWFYFSSACRPFGMVNLSPDTRTGDDWLHGYMYEDTKIRCFSHVDGWQYPFRAARRAGPDRAVRRRGEVHRRP
jgi:putative alpha-1,2-mannosidase